MVQGVSLVGIPGQVAFSVALVGEFAFYAYCLKVIPGESQRLTALVQSSQLGLAQQSQVDQSLV